MAVAGSQSNPRLPARLRAKLRLGHYSLRTEQAYRGWVVRYVRFHGLRHPAVLTRDEVLKVLAELDWVYGLIGMLLYGSGVRLLEVLTLRIKDVDLRRGETGSGEAKGIGTV